MAKKAIIGPQSQIPTTNDVINKFHNAATFSKLDLREAYYQFELTTDSRKVTKFYGSDGLLLYKRLNYGAKSAQDTLQNRMKEILGGRNPISDRKKSVRTRPYIRVGFEKTR